MNPPTFIGKSKRFTLFMTQALLLSLLLLSFPASLPQAAWGSIMKSESHNDTQSFTFYTDPPGADIKISFDVGATRKRLGKSGTPLAIDLKDAGNAEKIILFFEKLNYDLYTVDDLTPDYFRNHSRYPEDHELKLTSSYRKIIFLTDPPDALIYLDAYSNPQAPLYLCKGGDEFQLNTCNMAEGKEYALYFRLPHYKEWKESLSKKSLEPDKINYFPASKTPIRMVPDIPLIIPLYHWARNHMISTIVLVSVSVPLLAYAIFGIIVPGIRKTKESKARMAYWEALANKVDRKDPLFGARLGKYRILEKLGAGGMATVYTAVPEETLSENASVAIKVMQTDKIEDPQFVLRFKREMQISNNLRHPGILRVLDYGDREGLLYITMEHIRGKTLKKIIPGGGFTIDKFMEIFAQILEAVGYAHSKGVVHRDLKPENIMVTEEDKIVIMDFGLARSRGQSNITLSGTTIGTPAYMAPEQVKSAKYDSRSDQYSLGVIAYQMLTGDVPFRDEITVNVMLKQLQAEPPSLLDSRPDLPKGIEKVVFRMLEKVPEKRFDNLSEVEEALKIAIQDTLEGGSTGIHKGSGNA